MKRGRRRRAPSPRDARRRPPLAGAIASSIAIACAFAATPAFAQVAATLGIASQDRWRGTATDSRGPVVRASAMVDAPAAWADGAYAGLAGLWRVRDAGLANAEAIVGWSGRWNAIGAFADLDPGWGWDVGVHRMHYGAGGRYDFSEAMAGLVAPNGAARVWWSPSYFGGPWSSVYAELDANADLDDHWRVFGHVGTLRYGRVAAAGHVPGRSDALAGVGVVIDRLDLHLTCDGLVAGHAIDDLDRRARGAAWVLGASVAF